MGLVVLGLTTWVALSAYGLWVEWRANDREDDFLTKW